MIALSPTVTPRRICGAVADPDVRTDHDVTLVDALLADCLLGVGDVVVEVDEHRTVGDHALLTDADPLIRRDGALLADHGLGADLDHPLVAPDLAAMADPDEAPEADLTGATGLQLQSRAQEDHAVRTPAPARCGEEPEPEESKREPGVLGVEHLVGDREAERRESGPARADDLSFRVSVCISELGARGLFQHLDTHESG